MTIRVQQVIDLLLAAHPGEPIANTVDTLKFGRPDEPVTGIATCFLCTFEVALRAMQADCNLVITHEPTFYNHRDETAFLRNDPVYLGKLKFMVDRGMAVFRYHDYWHRLKPDGILTGMVKKLGWVPFQNNPGARFFTLPEQPLANLAGSIKLALGNLPLRIVGYPDMPVKRICLNPGYGNVPHLIELINTAETQVLVIGESPEWEIAEYVRDANAWQATKALIVLGHADSEEAGMEYLIEWLRPRLTETFGVEGAGVPMQHVPSGNPFLWL